MTGFLNFFYKILIIRIIIFFFEFPIFSSGFYNERDFFFRHLLFYYIAIIYFEKTVHEKTFLFSLIRFSNFVVKQLLTCRHVTLEKTNLRI